MLSTQAAHKNLLNLLSWKKSVQFELQIGRPVKCSCARAEKWTLILIIQFDYTITMDEKIFDITNIHFFESIILCFYWIIGEFVD